MKLRKLIVASSIIAGSLVSSLSIAEEDTIKVGVLHSLTGTMAISETTLKDTVLMMVEEQTSKVVCLKETRSRGGGPRLKLAVIC